MWKRSYVNVFFSVLLHFPNAIVFRVTKFIAILTVGNATILSES